MLAERPDLEVGLKALPVTFPEFMYHDAVVGRYWGSLFSDFAGFQIAVCDGRGEVLATGYCIPVSWDGTIAGLPAGLDNVIMGVLRGEWHEGGMVGQGDA
jgi:hypothetical protein